MATWDDVGAIVASLPETEAGSMHDAAGWRVRGKAFAWERPLRKTDLAALRSSGASVGEAPEGDILAARVPDLGAKQALLADDPEVYFTIPHFDGYPAILVRLDRIGRQELRELLVEAWLARAPKRLAAEYRDTLR